MGVIKNKNGKKMRSLADCLKEAGSVMETMVDEDGMPFDISKNEIAAQLIVEGAIPMDTDKNSPTFGERVIGDRRLLELWMENTRDREGVGINDLETALERVFTKLADKKMEEIGHNIPPEIEADE